MTDQRFDVRPNRTGTEMDRILFFINPAAGAGFSFDTEAEIAGIFKNENYSCRIVEIAEGMNAADISKTIDAFNPGTVVAGGGDGTVNLVAQGISGKDIALGIIPLGSSNGLAYELGIPDDPDEALKVIAGGKTRRIDSLIINGNLLCLHMCDLGMNARVIKRREKENAGGLLGYAKQYFKELGRKYKFRYTLNINGKQLSSKAVMIVLANSSYYGTGVSIAPGGEPDDGWFEVVIVKAYPFWFLFYMFISLFTKSGCNNRFRKTIRTKEVSLHVFPRQDMQVDGEPAGRQSSVQAKIQPAGIPVICR